MEDSAKTASCSGLNDILPALRRYRSDYQQLDGRPREEKLAVWKDVWKCITEASGNDPSYWWFLPPIYMDTASLRQIVQHLHIRFCARESSPKQLAQTGHIILSGMEGVGKSTIVRAFCLAVTILSATHFPIYVDYRTMAGHSSLSWTTQHLIDELFWRASRKDRTETTRGHFGTAKECIEGYPAAKAACDTLKGQSAVLARFGKLPVIVADEIQSVVQLEESTLKTRQATITSFQTYAREVPGAFLVMTGSAADLKRRLVFPSRARGYEGYQDLNKDLCIFCTVPPLRQLDDLQSFVRQRYGQELDDLDAGRLLHHTGGIGRLIDSFHTEDGSWEWELLNTSTRDEKLRSTFVSSPHLAAIVACIMRPTSSKDAEEPTVLCPAEVRVPLDTLNGTLCMRGPQEQQRLRAGIDHLVDSGILYVYMDHDLLQQVELALPSDVAVYQRLSADPMDVQRLYRVQLMMYFCDDAEFINAGLALEELMRPRISALMPLAVKTNCSRYITLTDGLLNIGEVGNNGLEEVTFDSLVTLSDHTWRWNKEVGLDAVQFAILRKADHTIVVTIHGWQCKGGRVNSKLTHGNWASEVKRIVKLGDDYTVDSTPYTVVGFQSKAGVGLLRLAGALLRIDDRIRVAFGKLVLTCTPKAAATISGIRATEEVDLTPLLQTIDCGVELASHGRLQQPCTLEWQIYLGDEWVRDCLEPELVRHLQSQAVAIPHAAGGGGTP